MSCSGCLYNPVLSFLSYPDCIILAALCCPQSCPGSPVSRQSWSAYLVLAVPFWLSFLAVLFWLSSLAVKHCPCSPILLSFPVLSCSSSPILPVPGGPPRSAKAQGQRLKTARAQVCRVLFAFCETTCFKIC
jgi:hypothetical protein